MGGFFNFLTTIATNGRGRPFDTFLALTSHYSGKSMTTLEEDARRFNRPGMSVALRKFAVGVDIEAQPPKLGC